MEKKLVRKPEKLDEFIIDRFEHDMLQLHNQCTEKFKKESTIVNKARIVREGFKLLDQKKKELKKILPSYIWEKIDVFTTFDDFRKAITLFKMLYFTIEPIKDTSFLEKQLTYLNQIAWEYITINNEFIWEKYKKLWNHPIWYLGIITRERYETIKNGIKPKGSFHHKPPYRDHLLTLFTTGDFVENHKRG